MGQWHLQQPIRVGGAMACSANNKSEAEACSEINRRGAGACSATNKSGAEACSATNKGGITKEKCNGNPWDP